MMFKFNVFCIIRPGGLSCCLLSIFCIKPQNDLRDCKYPEAVLCVVFRTLIWIDLLSIGRFFVFCTMQTLDISTKIYQLQKLCNL